ncbi:MAG: hypothetical protein A2Z81_06375 [Omnitrophica WOR_2 bacterium GWA2_45_18]|nr:MAG: hypothetical protein A2Z81_06375 [Omnitrophica WOR_2 bacterium GWA2_45_18]
MKSNKKLKFCMPARQPKNKSLPAFPPMSKCKFLILCVTALVILGYFLRGPERVKGYWSQSPFLRYMREERVRVQNKARGMTLSFFRPSFQPLADFVQGEALPQDAVNAYTAYYEKAAELYPELAEVHGVLGVCYYKQGDAQKAIDFLKKGASLNPDFFWHPYNLGVVYLKNKDYVQAEKFFRQAAGVSPQATLKTIYVSGVYRPVWGLIPHEPGDWMAQRLRQGYAQNYLFWGLCLKASGQDEAALYAVKQADGLKKMNGINLFDVEHVDLRIF